MNFSSSVMSGMGISLGGLEVVTDYLYANSDMYEPELTEIKATISHKPCKPVNRVKPVKPKASTQSIINKFSLIHTDKSKTSSSYDEVLEDTSIVVEQSDDFDFSFDDIKTAEEIKQEKQEENNAIANDLFNRLQNIGKAQQEKVIDEEESDDGFDFDTDDDMEIDPDDDYANEDLYDEEEIDDEDDGIDIDLEELSNISDKRLQEYKEQQVPKQEVQIKQEEVQSSNDEDNDDDFEFDLDEDSENSEEESDDDFEFDLGEDEDEISTEEEDTDEDDEFDFDLGEDTNENEQTQSTPIPSTSKPVIEAQSDEDEDDEFEFDIEDDGDDETEDESDDDFEFDIDEEEDLPAPVQKLEQKASVSQQPKQIIEQPKQESKAVVSQPEVAVKQGPTETELEMSRKIKQLEEQIQRLSSLQTPVQASNVVSKDIKKDSNFNRVTAKQQTVNQTVSTKPVTNYDRYSAMQIDVLYKEVREFIIQRGVREKLVDIAELHEKFGEPNIRKLINKSYIIRIGKGVTTGR